MALSSKELVKVDANFFVNKITGNIIQPDVLYPSYFTTGFPVSSFAPYVNYNDDKRIGFDFSVSLNKKLGEVDWTLGVTGTYYKTTASKRAEVYEDSYQIPCRANLPMRSGDCNTLGSSKTWPMMYKLSRRKPLAQVKPGDIKYKDQNGDGVDRCT